MCRQQSEPQARRFAPTGDDARHSIMKHRRIFNGLRHE